MLFARRFRTLGNSPQILTNNPEISWKSFCKHAGGVSGSWGTISGTYPNLPCSKPWAIAQAIRSNSADFGPLGIHPKSSPAIPKVVKKPSGSTQEAFPGVWNDFRYLPKSAIFKTMGYSPGFLLKIGRFRTLAVSPEILANNPESS